MDSKWTQNGLKMDSCGLIWTHVDSYVLTVTGLIWTLGDSYGLTWTHMDSYILNSSKAHAPRGLEKWINFGHLVTYCTLNLSLKVFILSFMAIFN